MSEKVNRLKDLRPSDQPVMYASVMLKLRRDYGGNAWVKRFFTYLARCPEAVVKSENGTKAQSMNWLVAASCAARRDLAGLFVDRWRMPLTKETRDALNAIDWSSEDIDPCKIPSRIH